jgi:hypothetical protein
VEALPDVVINDVHITDPGFGYVNAPNVTITDPTGFGAIAIAQVTNGRVSAINILNPGSGYSNPQITIAMAPPARRQYFSGDNIFTGSVIGNFTGNASGLTNIPTGQLKGITPPREPPH